MFVKPEHKNRISQVQQAVVRTGIANALGMYIIAIDCRIIATSYF